MNKLAFTSLLALIILSCSPVKTVDEDFEEEMKADSSLLTQLKDPDSISALKLNLADKYYKYYTDNPKSLTRNKAISASFKIWDYGSQFDKLRNAFSKLDVNDPLWPELFGRYRMSFIMENKMEEFLEELNTFASKAEHPKSVNYIFRELGDSHYRTFKNSADRTYRDSALYCYQKLVGVNSVEEDVLRAKKILYELDSLDINKPFPPFTVHDIDGNLINTLDYSGKVIIIDFWATWCGPCIPEIPYFKELRTKYDDNQLIIIGISLDRDIGQLKSFVQKEDMNWPHICDEQKWEGPIVNKYNGFRSIPKTYVIDGDGIIRHKDLRKEEFVAAVSRLIDNNNQQ